MKHRLKNIKDVINYLFGSKSTITLKSGDTGKWFTFKIRKHKEIDSIFFVSLLVGPDNDNSYKYLGTIFINDKNFSFKLTKKSSITKESLSFKAFNFFIYNLNKNVLHEKLEVYHNGSCSKCGRKLTTPRSLEIGMGPICSPPKKDTLKEIRLKKLKKLENV